MADGQTTAEGYEPDDAAVRAAYDRLHASDDFVELRRRFRRFVFPATVLFLVWYGMYVIAANYFHDFMAIKVVGNVNIALIFGLLQFVSTFLIAWLYARKAGRDFDPLAERLKNSFDAEVGSRAGAGGA
ncbi:MAG: DUF485 domain-containing protein [Streptosporangiales bacterium]|nr:DUF485 domain-containing protein [Streptosporangiales bacterium]